MKKFDGKVLLVLGSNVGSIDIVRYAKVNGAYTIVADNLSPDKSPAKMIANEHVLVSTGDIEELKMLIKNKGINGVFAGVSEFNLLKSIELCDYFGFPFYCTRCQWNLVENKDSFRELCVKYSVPCPKTYFAGNVVPEDLYEKIEYPIIVKPVDSSSSIGVFICSNEFELKEAIKNAIIVSTSKKIIIEDFFFGDEFSAHYTIANGRVTLSCVDNRYPVAVNEGQVTTVPIARIYPSTFLHEYEKQVNTQVLNLCQSLGLEAGVMFVQGLYNKDENCFSIFEAGLRCAGEAPYRFIERVNGVNFMNNLVDYSLLGCAHDFDSCKEDPLMKGKTCGIVSFVSKGGKVGKIEFKDAVKQVPSVIEHESRYSIGDCIPQGNTLRQIVMRFVMICDNKECMAKDVRFLNANVHVLNDEGEEMCLKFDPDEINDYE